MREQLQKQLTELAKADDHRVDVNVLESSSHYNVSYHRFADQALIDRLSALPEEVKTKRKWSGEDYMAQLRNHAYAVQVEIGRELSEPGEITSGRYRVNISGGNSLNIMDMEIMQLGVSLRGVISKGIPYIEVNCKNVSVHFLRDEPPEQDGFIRNLYQAIELVIEHASVWAGLDFLVSKEEAKLNSGEDDGSEGVDKQTWNRRYEK